MIIVSRLVTFSIFLAILFVESYTFGQQNDRFSAELSKKVDDAVNDQMKSQKLVGVAVGIVHEGKIAYLKGYGKSDIANDLPVTSKTIFNYASNSKPIVAVLAMQLAEKKQLDLDADIRKYLPAFPERDQIVTTRQLLCHQSGFPHYSNGKIVALSNERLSVKQRSDPEKSMLRFAKSPLLFKPGEKMSYSSYAYVILSAVIQKAGDQPIDDQLQERIAKPVGMPSFQLDFPRQDQENWTKAYRLSSNQFREVPDTAHYWKHGAGAYKSNVEDFAKWAAALLNGKLMKPETQKQMWTAQKFNNGNTSGFGLGFGVRTSQGRKIVSHSGSQDETKTLMVLYPESGNGIVILCNTAHAQVRDIELAIRKAILEK